MILSDVIVSTDKQPSLDSGTSPISLPMIQNNYWDWNEDFPESTTGDDYGTTRNYAIMDDAWDNTTEWRANRNYKTITGKIAPYKTAKADCYSYIQIYADDRLIYTSPKIGLRSDAVTFSVDISDCNYIKIVRRAESYSGIIISDVLLHE